ncbi:MogA/MoaB family molybdenum cofactor biosynthesis protein [Marisediminicola senii]|uniref:MogA/MoaB family molybdenum cofactor biosynthesis protein n=1 Tax=Marisediminicola senii TaxID=2711233 RepID=UPI0013E9C4B1|nr:MogA/MoaB family molybdenum cofactor biosynthesis protein [Marisediminicola senii]
MSETSAVGLDTAAPGTAADSAGRRTRRAVVIVASTRAAAGIYADETGPVIVEWARARGFEVDAASVVADGPDVAAALERALAVDPDLIVTTGGTGIAPTDTTPEATAPVLQQLLPGFQEELRRRGSAVTPFALMSRGLAGVAGNAFVVNLPGSTGGVRDGLALLDEVVDHVIDQLAGGRHDE